MFDSPEFYKDLLDNLHDGIYFVDRDRRVTFWNKGAERISGYTAAAIIGRHCRDNLLSHINAEGLELCKDHCPLAATMEDGQPREAEVFLHHANGYRLPVLVRAAPLRDQHGNVVGAVESFNDNSHLEKLRRRNEQLTRDTLQDPLTGVGNRKYLELSLQTTRTVYREGGTPFALLFLDIDHFKQVNDQYGHEAGDKALKMVANTLLHNLRQTDHIGRWGGEEFVVLLSDVDEEGMKNIAGKLLVMVAGSRLDLEARSLQVTVSIGATMVCPDDDPDSLVRRADELMYASKQAGRNRITVG